MRGHLLRNTALEAHTTIYTTCTVYQEQMHAIKCEDLLYQIAQRESSNTIAGDRRRAGVLKGCAQLGGARSAGYLQRCTRSRSSVLTARFILRQDPLFSQSNPLLVPGHPSFFSVHRSGARRDLLDGVLKSVGSRISRSQNDISRLRIQATQLRIRMKRADKLDLCGKLGSTTPGVPSVVTESANIESPSTTVLTDDAPITAGASPPSYLSSSLPRARSFLFSQRLRPVPVPRVPEAPPLSYLFKVHTPFYPFADSPPPGRSLPATILGLLVVVFLACGALGGDLCAQTASLLHAGGASQVPRVEGMCGYQLDVVCHRHRPIGRPQAMAPLDVPAFALRPRGRPARLSSSHDVPMTHDLSS